MIKNLRLTSFNLGLISAVILSFEIIATRISSVIFVNNYAFIILSLAILGLACGSIYAYYKIPAKIDVPKLLGKVLFGMSASLLLFIISVTSLPFIFNPFIYFFLLFLPFFIAGIFYAKVFETFAEKSFSIYAADLVGAALGSIASILVINYLGPNNGVLFLFLLVTISGFSYYSIGSKRNKKSIGFGFISLCLLLLILNGNNNLLNRIPIGDFPEKDFHHSYPGLNVISTITDSRWSVFGRTDLVEYNHQSRVKHLFIDGAAGSQMLRFDGDLQNQDPVITGLLLNSSGFIPYLFLEPEEKNSMLIIGPGGGKEVLSGLVTGIEKIVGVEINPDFVDIVKDQSFYNGGIYSNFSNVEILVQEGRQYVKQRQNYFDTIVMAMPSTQQLQSIDNFALSENHLLTVEAIQDYLDILTPEGKLIFTLHNVWEMKRLLVTTLAAFKERGIKVDEVLNHIQIIEKDYAPTIVIKKRPFSQNQTQRHIALMANLPETAPRFSYLPYNWENLRYTGINQFLKQIYTGTSIEELIATNEYDISPSYDDKPYFYKMEKGLPSNFAWLLLMVSVVCFLVLIIPYNKIKKQREKQVIKRPLMIFVCIGIGFMIVEIALFHKMILYLGSPTISLSVLLSALLIGMGTGSFFGDKIYQGQIYKRLLVMTSAIVLAGIIIIILYPLILSELLAYSIIIRSITSFLMLLPFGFLLGIPFPSAIQWLEMKNQAKYIPWMYGVNGAMSVLGSIAAIVFSMLVGFMPTFLIGIVFYAIIVLLLFINKNEVGNI